MYAVAVMRPGKPEIVEVPEPEPGPYDAVVRTEASFICNVTDREVIEGNFPGMGEECYPLLLGHESVGRVVEIGEKVTSFSEGDRAIGGLLLDPPGGRFQSGWGGHSQYIVMKDHHAMVSDGVADEKHGWNEVYKVMLKVPEDLPVEAAGMLCTWREVYSALLTDFALKPDSEIAVFGAGPVGLSFVRFARALGFPYVACVDPNPEKREKAVAMGADQVFPRDDPALEKLVGKRGRPLDAVIDAVGREAVINTALSLIGMDGLICVYGVVAEPSVTLKKDRGPYNFRLLVHQWPTRDAEAAAQEPLTEWIREGKLDHRDFVTGVFPVREFEKAFAETKKKTNTKTMLVYD